MRLVIQRVSEASVSVPAENYLSSIGKGLLVLAAFIDEDNDYISPANHAYSAPRGALFQQSTSDLPATYL